MNDYPPNWSGIALDVKDAADWKCVRCGHPNEFESSHVLTVHHLDGNKANCRWWNLAALCQRCHLSIQGRVVMDQNYMLPHSDWFLPYVAGYYAFTKLGENFAREEIERDLAHYLSIGQPHLEEHYKTRLAA